MKRREFTSDQRAQIVARATDAAGTIRCERCQLAQKPGSFEIDHILAEGMRPEVDKKVKLTISDGQLLGKDCCHRGEDGKTNDDVAKIAKAKRREAKHLGTKRPAGKLKGRGFPASDKPERITKQPLPPRAMFRLWPASSNREGD